MIVIDSSIFAAAILPDESCSLADDIIQKIINREIQAYVPPLFYVEITNTFLMAFRRKRITEKNLLNCIKVLPEFFFTVDTNGNLQRKTELAIEHNLTIYDATFIELAERRSIPLATLDKALQKAGTKMNLIYAL